MDTTIDQVADGIYRISTFVPDANLSFNQILVTGEEPFLFHTGMRALFPLVSDAVGRVVPLERIRWIGFGHVEADECGSLDQWMAAAPSAQVAFGGLGLHGLGERPRGPAARARSTTVRCSTSAAGGCATSPPRTSPTAGSRASSSRRRPRRCSAATCSPRSASGPALSEDSPLPGTVATEDVFGYSCLGPATVPTVERLADLEPRDARRHARADPRRPRRDLAPRARRRPTPSGRASAVRLSRRGQPAGPHRGGRRGPGGRSAPSTS